MGTLVSMPYLPRFALGILVLLGGCTTPIRLDGGELDAGTDAASLLDADPDSGMRLDAPIACTALDDCLDLNPCTDDLCSEGRCMNIPDDARGYDDGDVCTTGDACVDGVPTPGSPLACEDGFDCTVDTCVPGTGCVSTPDDDRCTAGVGGRCNPTAGCQYGSACNATTCMATNACETAVCMGDLCMRAPRICPDDGNPCTRESCDILAGCVAADITGPCDDGNACTTGEDCNLGTCTGGRLVLCDDGNACTVDSCNPGAGCVYASRPNGVACGAGDPAMCIERTCSSGTCTTSSTCEAGQVCCGADTCASSMLAC